MASCSYAASAASISQLRCPGRNQRPGARARQGAVVKAFWQQLLNRGSGAAGPAAGGGGPGERFLYKPSEAVELIGGIKVSPMGLGTWSWGNRFLWGYEEEMDPELQQVMAVIMTDDDHSSAAVRLII